MAHSLRVIGILCLGLFLNFVQAQPQGSPTTTTASVLTATIAGKEVTYSPQFTVPASADEGANLIPNIYDPEAKDAQSLCPGYKASNVVETEYGLSAILTLAGPACSVYGNDVDTLKLDVQYQNEDRLSVLITPAKVDASNSSWFVMPENIVPRPSLEPNSDIRNIDLAFTWSNDPTFSFTITRKSTGDAVFDTRGSKLVYEDQFVEFVSTMPENYNVYGLGEQLTNFRLGNNYTATIWAADAGDPIDRNIYSSQAQIVDTRYYEIDAKGNRTLVTDQTTNTDSTYESFSHGIFLRNAHGQEVLLRSDNITWRTLGGSIDLFFFDGPDQPSVTRQYQKVVGLPAMQQYFSFGYHQCRWGYQNWTVVQEVIDNFKAFDIPLETVWLDIDYMQQYRDFVMDSNTFSIADSKQFLDRLHGNHQHFVPIVDSAIYRPNPDNATDAYAPYERGAAQNVFVKNSDGSEYIGAVWPGYTVFPDWQADGAVSWWINEMTAWYKDVNFDGIWIDMSEASSFCIGSCGTGNLTLNPAHPPFALPGEPGNLVLEYPEGFNLTNATEAASASSALYTQTATTSASVSTETGGQTQSSSSSASVAYLRTTPTPGVRNVELPPYVINNIGGQLGVHGLAPNATHASGYQDYDVHNVFGHQILNATYQALLNVFPGKRPFIIGRSTFSGSGQWAGHWGGDNFSKWLWMEKSISQALAFSLYGIPMFGTDTCGFTGNSDEELCNRWMQLSAWFPFYRNHNVLAANPQEPYVWASVAEATRKSIAIRYSLLPYMYTLFHQAHTTGSTVMRAPAWEFPNDPSLAAADRQFLLGPSIMITPVLTQGAKTVNGVFPGAGKGERWYDWYTQTIVDAKAGENKTISAPLGHIPVYIRGGSVLPQQEPGYTTYESRRNPWGVLVALSAQGSATGSLYVDDGESISPNATLNVVFAASNGTFSATVSGDWKDPNPLANITVLGLSSQPGAVLLNGSPLDSGVDFNSTAGVLKITDLARITSSGAWAGNWTLKWA